MIGILYLPPLPNLNSRNTLHTKKVIKITVFPYKRNVWTNFTGSQSILVQIGHTSNLALWEFYLFGSELLTINTNAKILHKTSTGTFFIVFFFWIVHKHFLHNPTYNREMVHLFPSICIQWKKQEYIYILQSLTNRH